MFTKIQYQILKGLFPRSSGGPAPSNGNPSPSRLRALLGDELLHRVKGETVIDFGCGEGNESIELARAGARSVVGIDIREEILQTARAKAAAADVADRCRFTTESAGLKANLIVSIDAFEHFSDPASILQKMEELLSDAGEVIVSFGPTWYHPSGGHLFSVFPWAHLLFTEEALIRWRADFKSDGATAFGDVEGGLNQMSISRFETIVRESPFRFRHIEAVPIRKLRRLHTNWTREFTTAIVRCSLIKKSAAQSQATRSEAARTA
jgi:SAM-dependent methyltransferase